MAEFRVDGPGISYAYLDDYRRTRKDLYHKASTVEGLAEDIGVAAATLRSAIDEHNAKLQPGKSTGDQRQPVSRGPFYALGPVQSWIVFTEGGLAVSRDHEVINRTGDPVPGLYAAGSAGQGGVILAGHGHHIGWAMVSGRRAGRFAAERAASTKLATAGNRA
ncbi:FAD-binding protein [Paraburkholderia dipogonis]|uniref:FAD-binding protein n=1 Tax=Paraburkholderia dipogonis TaxID=1211383 RepID=UPI001FCB8BE2|nr:FAD-binding protein [Paraburkholderia dipogonis]